LGGEKSLKNKVLGDVTAKNLQEGRQAGSRLPSVRTKKNSEKGVTVVANSGSTERQQNGKKTGGKNRSVQRRKKTENKVREKKKKNQTTLTKRKKKLKITLALTNQQGPTLADLNKTGGKRHPARKAPN